jgi:hypothetical protein
MFNFLNSAVLIAAAAALIPLLIHLFSKRRVKIVEFSSLRHLKEMQKRQVRRIKIRQILLLLLRMLIILIAVLAFARPVTEGGFIGTHAGVSSVILLDRSASMQRQVKDGVLFDLAIKKTADILENFGESDEVALIPFDRQTYFEAGERFFSRDVAENILNEIQTGNDIGDLGSAIKKGLEMLDLSENLNREMFIITDRQLNSLPEQIDTFDNKIACYLADLPVEVDGNCGIVSLDMGGQLIEVGSPFDIKVEIRNYDLRDKSNKLVSLFMDGFRVMQSEFDIESDGRQIVRFSHTVNDAGFHYGSIRIADDDFSSDNNIYFTFNIPEQFNVLIIDGDLGGEIIRMALNPSEELSRYWSVKMVGPDQLASVRFGDYDVVIMSGVASLGEAESSRLVRYVDGGGGLFYILGSTVNQEYFNINFGKKFDCDIVNPIPEQFSGAGYYILERIDYSHPIFKPFADIYSDEIPTFRFFALPDLSDGSSNRDIAFFSNGSPAVVEARYGLGRMMLITASILPRYSDIAGHSFFVPLVIRTAEYLARDLSSYETENFIGRNILRPVSGRVSRYETVDMVNPDNKVFQIAGIDKSGQLVYDCQPVDLPGIYMLRGGRRIIDIFPANIDPAEGDLTFVEPARLAASLGINDLNVIPYESGSAKLVSENRYGRELWKLFLWAVVVLMAVEMIFSRERSQSDQEA